MDKTTELQVHPTFHRNSMIVAFLLGAVVFIFGGISIHAENRGNESPIPAWLTVSTMGLLIGWMLYRALLARPSCPSCSSSDTKWVTDCSKEEKGSRETENWRHYQCAACDDEFLIPGLSLHG